MINLNEFMFSTESRNGFKSCTSKRDKTRAACGLDRFNNLGELNRWTVHADKKKHDKLL
jgi:hypothetical protein